MTNISLPLQGRRRLLPRTNVESNKNVLNDYRVRARMSLPVRFPVQRKSAYVTLCEKLGCRLALLCGDGVQLIVDSGGSLAQIPCTEATRTSDFGRWRLRPLRERVWWSAGGAPRRRRCEVHSAGRRLRP